MQAEKHFQPARVWLLMRNAVMLNLASAGLVTAALTGILMLISLIDAFGSCSPQFHNHLYPVVFFPAGLLLTSRIFKTLHDPVKGISWLLLPASALEKTVSAILLSTLAYIAGSILFYLLFSILSEIINNLVFHRGHDVFNPFNPSILNIILTYIAVQAPFLTGAVYFKKHVLSKTILSLLGFLVVLGSGVLLAAWIIFGDQWPGLEIQSLFYSYESGGFTTLGLGVINTARLFFWFVIPVISWAVCYVRLRETEL